MTPTTAARRLARRFLRSTFRNVLDVIDPVQTAVLIARDSAARQAAYRRLECCVRRHCGVTEQDENALHAAVISAIASVPPEHQEAMRAAFNAYDAYATETLTVKEQAAYLIGIEIGSALARGGDAR
jgi:hypothetical protein